MVEINNKSWQALPGKTEKDDGDFGAASGTGKKIRCSYTTSG